jgi:hypothetical protein
MTWQPIETAKPVHVRPEGVVYERDYAWPDKQPSVYKCKFKDGKWYSNAPTVADAMNDDYIAFYQYLPWRGLATKPKGWK